MTSADLRAAADWCAVGDNPAGYDGNIPVQIPAMLRAGADAIDRVAALEADNTALRERAELAEQESAVSAGALQALRSMTCFRGPLTLSRRRKP